MPNKLAFQSSLKSKLPPLLREHGFRGSGSRFFRLTGDVLHVVELQAGGGGSGLYVNLGVHHAHLGLEKSAAKDVRAPSCPFRMRLRDFAGGDFFPYGESAEEREMSILSLTEGMKTEGMLFFDAFGESELPRLLKELAKKGYATFPALSAPAAPSTWAELAKALGDAASATLLAAQQQAIDDARAEEARRKRVIDELVATRSWDGRTFDCMNEACASLEKAQFATWERELKKAAPEGRMDAIMPYLEKHHAEVVERVASRHKRASLLRSAP